MVEKRAQKSPYRGPDIKIGTGADPASDEGLRREEFVRMLPAYEIFLIAILNGHNLKKHEFNFESRLTSKSHLTLVMTRPVLDERGKRIVFDKFCKHFSLVWCEESDNFFVF